MTKKARSKPDVSVGGGAPVEPQQLSEDEHLRTERAWVRIPRDIDNMLLEDAEKNPLMLCRNRMTSGQFMDLLLLDSKMRSFKECGNPVLMIEAFLVASREGVYPPNEVMDWLAGCFQAFHDAQGKVPMDTCMGLKKRGGTPPFKALMIEERNDMTLGDMSTLMCLGATREEAALIVWHTLTAADWNKSAYEMSDPSCETLIDLHARWKSHRDWKSWWIEHLDKPGNAANFLQKFDRQHLPEKLLRLL
jgi:hypothetical protein